MKHRWVKGAFLTAALALLTVFNCAYAETVPFDSDKWEIRAEESRVEDFLGRKNTLFIKEGYAMAKGSEFKNGVISYDIAFDRGLAFVGVMARAEDHENFERFYMRLHLSGTPDAVQYTPYFNAMTGWQLYADFRGGAKFHFNKWNRVKILFADKRAEMYINDMEKPVLAVNELKRPAQAGKVGIFMEMVPFLEMVPVHISDFSYTETDSPPLKGKYDALKDTPEGTVMSWEISDVFDERTLEGKYSLSDADRKKLAWKKLTSERSGLANLARLHAVETLLETGVKVGKNCVFAHVSIQSDKDQVKKMSLGFSDKVRVYFNDQLLFSANDTWRSRGLRFQGLIGYYDDIYLPLKKGGNELWLAVSEAMPDDGWGVQARFENMDGMKLKEW